MRKIMAWLLVLCFAVMCTACGGTSDGSDRVELVVFAAASMTETLTELGDQYMTDHPEITILFNFDSSGTLKTQIQEGADCDVFISAGQKQMDQLETDGLILTDTRFDILENKVSLAVPEDNPAAIHSYGDLSDGLYNGSILLAMGNADVPVGQYTQKILDYYDLNEEELAAKGVITYSSNVKEIATQIAESTVDCGVLYQTDAFSAGLTVVDTADADMCGQVIYPAAVVNASAKAEAAQGFLNFLTTDAADTVFAAVGFTPIA